LTHTRCAAVGARARAQHRESKTNTGEEPFDFTDDNYKVVAKIMAKYPKNYRASAVIPMLDLAQRQAGGWLPLGAGRTAPRGRGCGCPLRAMRRGEWLRARNIVVAGSKPLLGGVYLFASAYV
jgi:NADH:ubiquinone oxidoreductase subunit E